MLSNISLTDGALSLEDAIEAFDACADMGDISFGYPEEGCFARAHLMCKALAKHNLNPGKAWAFENRREFLCVVTPDRTTYKWWYHVAPTLPVRQGCGKVIDMVIDPSLFDGPVTREQWRDVLSADDDRVHCVALEEPPPGYSGNYTPRRCVNDMTDDDATEHMEKYLTYQSEKRRLVYPTKCRQIVCRLQNGKLPREGLTWKSSDMPPPRSNVQNSPEQNSFNDTAGIEVKELDWQDVDWQKLGWPNIDEKTKEILGMKPPKTK